MQRTLIIIGITFLLIGLLWPWLAKLPFGRLPGDILISKPNFTLYIPLTTMFLVSLLISLLIWFLKK